MFHRIQIPGDREQARLLNLREADRHPEAIGSANPLPIAMVAEPGLRHLFQVPGRTRWHVRRPVLDGWEAIVWSRASCHKRLRTCKLEPARARVSTLPCTRTHAALPAIVWPWKARRPTQ